MASVDFALAAGLFTKKKVVMLCVLLYHIHRKRRTDLMTGAANKATRQIFRGQKVTNVG